MHKFNFFATTCLPQYCVRSLLLNLWSYFNHGTVKKYPLCYTAEPEWLYGASVSNNPNAFAPFVNTSLMPRRASPFRCSSLLFNYSQCSKNILLNCDIHLLHDDTQKYEHKSFVKCNIKHLLLHLNLLQISSKENKKKTI